MAVLTDAYEIHTPGVDTDRGNPYFAACGFAQPPEHLFIKMPYIPVATSAVTHNAVWEAGKLLQLQFAVGKGSEDCAPGSSTQVYC